MGYSGEVYYNEEEVYQEWKHDNVTFCLTYAQTYLRQKPCLLTQEAINAAYSYLYGGAASGSFVLYRVNEAMDILKALTAASVIFDNDGNLTGAIKVQGKDEHCGSAAINFYEADRISNVPEVTLDDRCRVAHKCPMSHNDLIDINVKRVSSIDLFSIAPVCRTTSSYQNYYELVEDIMNIKTRNDLYKLVETMQEMLKSINDMYIKKCTVAETLADVLRQASEAIASGISVYVSYTDDFLCTSIGENTIKTEVDFFIVSELFQNNGITPCSAYVWINDKKTLMDFINSFPKNKERNPEFEEIFKDISLEVDDSEFSILISGGY